MLARALILCTLLPLAACAAMVPGYTPPSFKDHTVKPMQSGDMDGEGTYHMSNQEKSTDCRHLKGAMMVTINRLRHRGSEVDTSPFAIGANKMARPLLGGSEKGLDRDAEYQRDRARLDAYNRHLADRGCPTVDIEAELRRPPDS
jgi:hypothetical protein